MEKKERITEALCAMLKETDGLETWIEDAKRVGSGDYEHWGPKDLLAHAAEWTERRVELLRTLDKLEPEGADESAGDINRVLFERHKDTPWDDLIGMLGNGLNALIREVARRDETELLAEDPHAQGNTVWRGIAFYGIVHSLTHIGQALVRSGQPAAAVRLQRAMTPLLLAIDDGGAWRGMIEFNLGRVLLLAGERDAAIEQLRLAVADNPLAEKWVANDPDFESIRGEV